MYHAFGQDEEANVLRSGGLQQDISVVSGMEVWERQDVH